MKKLIVFLFAFVFAICFVKATVTVDGNSSQNVTVGDVEVPVYEVVLNWYGMVYDWGYFADTGEYGWKTKYECTEAFNYVDASEDFLEYVNDGGILYSNNTCTSRNYDDTYDPNTSYYQSIEIVPLITVEDMSTGGIVVPSIAYAANSKYNFTTMGFQYYKNDGTKVTLNSGALPNEARLCMKGDDMGPLCDPDEFNVYHILPVIGIDSNKTVTTPTTGETIGTITLTFATN